jgi:hypothetical protein
MLSRSLPEFFVSSCVIIRYSVSHLCIIIGVQIILLRLLLRWRQLLIVVELPCFHTTVGFCFMLATVEPNLAQQFCNVKNLRSKNSLESQKKVNLTASIL